MARRVKDPRYSVQQEFTGHISGKARWVVRFEGERIRKRDGSQYPDYPKERSAIAASQQHAADREVDMKAQLEKLARRK